MLTYSNASVRLNFLQDADTMPFISFGLAVGGFGMQYSPFDGISNSVVDRVIIVS